MGVYLDIDLDYLVKPVRQKGINEFRIYKNDIGTIADYKRFIDILDSKGLLKAKEKKFFTNHKKSYTYWWIKKSMNMTVIHIDAHSDLYRNRQSDLTKLSDVDMDCNDYMWYALRDGFISTIYWVVPDELYNLSDKDIAKQFINKDMIIKENYKDGMLKIVFKVETRKGYKEIEYFICTLDKLPNYSECDIMTVATSPEFIPQTVDEDIKKVLFFLGASDEEINRISKQHADMPEKQMK